MEPSVHLQVGLSYSTSYCDAQMQCCKADQECIWAVGFRGMAAFPLSLTSEQLTFISSGVKFRKGGKLSHTNHLQFGCSECV